MTNFQNFFYFTGYRYLLEIAFLSKKLFLLAGDGQFIKNFFLLAEDDFFLLGGHCQFFKNFVFTRKRWPVYQKLFGSQEMTNLSKTFFLPAGDDQLVKKLFLLAGDGKLIQKLFFTCRRWPNGRVRTLANTRTPGTS